MSHYEITEISSPEAIRELSSVLHEVFKMPCGDPITLREAVLCGGYCIAVRAKDKTVGGAWGMPGVDQQGTFMQSFWGGMLPQYINQGIGLHLGQAQLDATHKRKINRFCYTFDPLHIQRAHFFINKLGAIADAYLPNCFGDLAGTLGLMHDQPLPSDRFHITHYLSENPPKPAQEKELVHIPAIKDSSSPQLVLETLTALQEKVKPLLDQGKVIDGIQVKDNIWAYQVTELIGTQ